MSGKLKSHAICWLMTSLFLVVMGCASKKPMLIPDTEKIKENQEFDKLVEVKEVGKVQSSPDEKKVQPVKKEKKSPPPKKNIKKGKSEETKKGAEVARQPEIEDSEGFDGRRPVLDPFVVGEEVVLDLSYFNIVAGTMTLSVKPFVEVNGKKAYSFTVDLKSNPMFSRFYSVEDEAITHVDYDELVPLTHHLSVKETKQLRDIRSYFDFEKNIGRYWEKKVTPDKGEQDKRYEWAILPYSQNVVSAAFYMRTFTLRSQKKLAFRVADEGKNIVFTGEVLRKEKLKTALGVLDTVVLRPTITVDGVFKPVGEVIIWMTDDERKFIVRIESKIKIGTIVAKLKSIKKS